MAPTNDLHEYAGRCERLADVVIVHTGILQTLAGYYQDLNPSGDWTVQRKVAATIEQAQRHTTALQSLSAELESHGDNAQRQIEESE